MSVLTDLCAFLKLLHQFRNFHEANLWNADALQSEYSIPCNTPAYVTAKTYIEMYRNRCNVSSNKISHLVHLC